MDDARRQHRSRILLRSRQCAWLRSESNRWLDAAVVDATTRDRILELYDVEPASRHGIVALLLIGAVMFGAGVLLLIGYNWAGLSAPVKIAILIGSVIASFAASAVAFARGRAVAGETVALIAVLLFGNSIWLIAQVLHIQGNFPDAFMLWTAGAVGTTILARSRIVGIASTVLLGIWTGALLSDGGLSILPFLVLASATIAAAYALKSPAMLTIAGAAIAVWSLSAVYFHGAEGAALTTLVMCGCFLYSIGASHDRRNPLGCAWKTAGLAALLLGLFPLLNWHFYNPGRMPLTREHLTVGIVFLAGVVAMLLRPVTRFKSSPGLLLTDAVVAITAIVAAAQFVLSATIMQGRQWTIISAMAFSVLTVGLSVALIQEAIRDHQARTLSFGVGFALSFLLVRWIVTNNMAWSGIAFLLVSGSLFVLARLGSGGRYAVAAPSEHSS